MTDERKKAFKEMISVARKQIDDLRDEIVVDMQETPVESKDFNVLSVTDTRLEEAVEYLIDAENALDLTQ